MDDGRHIHPLLGLLEGEAASQKAMFEKQRPVPPAKPAARPPFAPDAAKPSYYGLPAIKEPVWAWVIPSYFFVGGAAGAAATLGAIAQLVRGDAARELVLRCRGIAMAGTLLSTAFLVYDLGRPSRFLNMLRVFRPTSPMSVGSWVLASTGAAAGVAALGSLVPPLAPVADAAALAAGAGGLPLTGYTAVLLSNSVVPLWSGARRTLPFLFVSSGVATAAALLERMSLSPAEHRIAHRFGVIGKLGEALASIAVEREIASSSPRAARPLRRGWTGVAWRAASLLTIGAAAVSLSSKGERMRRLSSALSLGGALLSRFAIHYAGKKSALDPEATFEQQRRRMKATAADAARPSIEQGAIVSERAPMQPLAYQ